ncbi:MAG: UDP-N-acetylmuramoyl-L-alanyl-D-glutamate--2,6-diaminopimelate ligase [Treponema sp.]|jgi:UDP-N-acetylmuramoyl-L-alanyl-D-glutamate--2,6-diaminopimelate ligase|nr:UDP-N-acetylmuramoyl-L-alanyl-D-glutamate--2,6-diaminopimelate ligase [Treponema sp.]
MGKIDWYKKNRRLSEFFNEELQIECIETRSLGDLDPIITSLEYDSRKIKPGSLYFALAGLHKDGRLFIADAIERGAVVVVYQTPLTDYSERVVYIRVKDSRFSMSAIAASFYGFPSEKLRCVGITGTEGKSTTVFLIWQLLRMSGRQAGFISTVQTSTGGESEDNTEHQTTPEATVIHKQLAQMLDNGVEFAVLETSSHGLSPKTNRLGDVVFTAGVMTNVTHEHLEFHGTWEQYRSDKANLFRNLRVEGGFGVINADDPSCAYFAAVTDKPIFTYSTNPSSCADLSLLRIESFTSGNAYTVHVKETDEYIAIQDNLPGAFNVGNVMAAMLTVSKLLAIPIREAAALIPGLQPVRGRMTAVRKGQPFEVLVDYAHTPSSFQTIFPPLRERVKGRIISLFGSPGERDTKKRPEQGRVAALYSDIVILSDEDPRGEASMSILEEIAAGVPNLKRDQDLFLIPNRPLAIRKAFSLARDGDIVLLLGKGHENSIIYADGPIPYDEIAEAEKALAELAQCCENT